MNDQQTRRRGKGELRPGAMTAAMRAAQPAGRLEGPRWLRWAWVEDGRIVAERVIGPSQQLRGGTDLPASAPDRVLARYERGAWRLTVHRDWEGRLASGPLRAFGEPDDDGWADIELAPEARGRVAMPGGALLVQLVPKPAEPRTRTLPVAFDGGLFARTDWRFTAFVTGSFLAHFALAVGLMEADWPVEPGLPDPRIAVVMFPEEVEPTNVPEMDVERGDGEEAPLADATDRGDGNDAPSEPSPRSRPGPARPTADSTPTLADAQQALSAVHLTLGTALGQSNSAIQNLIADGAATDDQASIMASVDGVELARADGPMAERSGSHRANRAPGDMGQLRRRPGVAGRPSTTGRPLEEREVVVTTQGLPPVVDYLPPEWTGMRGFVRQLRARMRAVQRCYEHEITRGTVRDGGRLRVSMRIMPVGTLSGVQVVENSTGSSSLAQCAERSIRSIRVRPAPPEMIEVDYPIVFSRVE